MDLNAAVAVVTGGASGIGKATAVALGRAGADVVVADINGPECESVAAEIESSGRRAISVRADLSRRDEMEKLVERAISWQGRCDVFVANVGVGCDGAPQDFSPEEWEYLLAVNLWSAIWPLRSIVPHMLERGAGWIVFLSSGSGFEGSAPRAPYNVAKFGIVGLSESLARSLKGTGVGVSLVVPGAVATTGWKNYVIAGSRDMEADEIQRRRLAERDHMADWPRPEVMADAIVDGIRQAKYCIVQDNPYEPGWLANLLERKGRDPDAFVLG